MCCLTCYVSVLDSSRGVRRQVVAAAAAAGCSGGGGPSSSPLVGSDWGVAPKSDGEVKISVPVGRVMLVHGSRMLTSA